MNLNRYAVAGAYPIRFSAKQSTEVLDYTLDFGPLAALAFPTTLTSVTWAIVALAGDGAPLAITNQQLTSGLSTFRLSAGTPLVSYSVRGTCVWSDGETSVVSFTLPIAATPGSAIPQ